MMMSIKDCAFTKPDPAIIFFNDKTERMARLGYALRDEYAFNEGLDALCDKRPNNAVAFPLTTKPIA
jgi:hypothetical protein